MLTPTDGKGLPDHVKAIIDTIDPGDTMNVIIPIGFVLNYLEGRGDDPVQPIKILRGRLNQDADVLLEWLGIVVDETGGEMKVSMKEGTDLDGVEMRFDRFSSNL